MGRRKVKVQSRLDFTPVASSSPTRHEAYVRIDDSSTPRKRQRILQSSPDSGIYQSNPDLGQSKFLSIKDSLKVVNSPQRKSHQLPTPEPSSQIQVQESGTDVGHKLPKHGGVRRQTPTRDAATTSSKSMFSNSPTMGSDEDSPVRSSRRTRRAPATVDDSSDNSIVITSPSKRMRRESKTSSASPSSETPSKPTPSRTPTARSFLAGGSSGNAPIPRSQRLVSRFTQPKKGVGERDMSESDSETLTETTRRSPGKANHQRNDEHSVDSNDQDEVSDDVIERSFRRRASKAQPKEQSEDDDSMLEELADVEDANTPAAGRTRNRRKNAARNKRLEGLAKLRQRRAGVIEESEDEDAGDGESSGVEDNIIGDDTFHQEPDEEVEVLSKNLDDYESDFVENDGEIGVDLMRSGVPLSLTNHANKKPFEYFKDEIEWMIHNKLDPAFERHDEIYEMAHRKLNDEVVALAGSEFKSSIWKEDFTKALQNRPEFFTTLVGIDMMEPKCQACNRSKHPPKWMITFSGPTYDRKSLERVSQKSDDTSDSSSDGNDDEEEEKEEVWHVGSVCCGNAEVAHTLYHWRFQLNTTVLQWLTVNGYTSPDKVVERENWSRKKREKLANKVVDGMLESGEMRSLYKQFKQNLDAARAAKDERIER